MENPYSAYYVSQAGNGIPGFTGTRFQRGHGFCGRIFSGIMPILRYLGKQALSTGVSVAQDALKGNNVKTSIKRNAADTIANVADDFSKRAKLCAQTGSGRRRKRQAVKKTTVKRKTSTKKPKNKKTRKKHKRTKRKNDFLS